MNSNKIVLASGSPYRKELLAKLKLEFIVANPDIDEAPLINEKAEELAIRLSKAKALAVCEKYPDHLIIGSDQVAMLNGIQLKKPGNLDNCIKQLLSVSGKKLQFFTSVCVIDSSNQRFFTELDQCIVHFKTLTQKAIERYVEIEKPYYCAGAFKSESLGIALIERIEGEDPNALVGLPLIKLIKLLEKFNLQVL